MKIFLLISALSFPTYAQQQPALLSDPPDGTQPPALEIRYAFKPAEVLDTTITRQGGRNIIVQHLALDPSDPVKPVRNDVRPEAPVLQSQTGFDFDQTTQLLLLSATVYPGPATRLAWTYNFEDGSSTEISGWSNIDWNHFTGVTTFLATDGTSHSFIMGIGTETEPATGTPVFESEAPTFLPDQQNIPPEALLTVDSLHKLYALENVKLAAAYESRRRNESVRAAELAANPLQPKDLIIRYRIAETPMASDVNVQTPESR